MTLREARLKRKYTQERLAELSGVEQPTISSLESGKTQPTWETAYRISLALKVKPEEIFPVREVAS